MKKLWLWILIIGSGSLGWTQTENPVRKISEEQCLEMGLAYSQQLLISKMNVVQAQAEAGLAQARRLPTLSSEVIYTRLSKVPDSEISIPIPPFDQYKFIISSSFLQSASFKLSLQQPLFTGLALENAVKATRFQMQTQQENLKKDRQNLIMDLRNAYWSVVKARQFQDLVRESIVMVESHLNDVQHFLDQGLATRNEVLKVQVQLSGLKVKQLEVDHGYQMARMYLNSLLGLPLEEEIELTSEVTTSEEVMISPELAVTQALNQRPEIIAAAQTMAASQAGIKISQAGYYPNVFLVGNWSISNPNQRIFPLQDKFQSSWDLSLGLTWNLWNWGSVKYQVQMARARQTQAEAGHSLLRDGISLQVRQSCFEVQQCQESISLADTQVQQAEENHRITKERFTVGLTANSELLDAEVAWLQAKINKIQAQIDYKLAQARLKKAMGIDDWSKEKKQ